LVDFGPTPPTPATTSFTAVVAVLSTSLIIYPLQS
jgi:hypothetical protein